MKKTLLFALLAFCALSAEAQVTAILYQDFEDSSSIEEQQWGAIDVDGDDLSYSLTQTQNVLVQLGFTGNVMSSQNFYMDDENNPVEIEGSDNILVTPIITLPNENNLNFSVRVCGIGTTLQASASYKIYVINALDLQSATEIADIIEVIDQTEPVIEESENSQTTGTSTVRTVNLDEYQGQTVVLFIRHTGSDGITYLFLDDVNFTSGVLSTDIYLQNLIKVYPNPVTETVYSKYSKCKYQRNNDHRCQW